MNWKPGDIAIIGPKGHDLVGESVELTKFVGAHVKTTLTDMWEVDYSGNQWLASESVLRNPYDGYEKCSWEDCIFKPTELVTY